MNRCCRLFGYKTVDDYYIDSRIDEKKIMAIRTPTLCLNANDDAFSPQTCKYHLCSVVLPCNLTPSWLGYYYCRRTAGEGYTKCPHLISFSICLNCYVQRMICILHANMNLVWIIILTI